MLNKIAYPNHRHSFDFLCFNFDELLINESETYISLKQIQRTMHFAHIRLLGYMYTNICEHQRALKHPP